MRLWDRAWTATTTLPVTSGTFDGTRGLGWDGTSLYLTDGSLSVSVVCYNGLGTETGRVSLTSDPGERSAGVRVMHVVSSRLVLGWVHATSPGGSVVHHRIQVVDLSSFP